MEQAPIVVFFILFLALIAFGAYYAHQQSLRRQAELRDLAGRLGWQFDPASDSTHDERYQHFSVFQQGHSRQAYNTLRGGLDVGGHPWRVQMGDYLYRVTSSNGKHTTTRTYRLSYAIVTTPFIGTPPLTIRREGMFDKLGGFLGFDDIDFESAEFSDRFHVKSTDKRYAYDVLHPRMMEFLMNGDPPTIDVAAGEACFYRRNTVWTADQFNNVLAWTRDFFNLWPRHLQPTTENQPQSS